jgi:hypothetical protein
VHITVVGVQLSVVTDGAPEKGRRYHTFSHTERASVATIYLSDPFALLFGLTVTEKLGVVTKFNVVRTCLTTLNF